MRIAKQRHQHAHTHTNFCGAGLQRRSSRMKGGLKNGSPASIQFGQRMRDGS
jgi:hypothetical protein